MKPSAIATNSTANGAALILLAIYLVAVMAQGNLFTFLPTAWDDFTKREKGQPAFWQWTIALIVLYALSNNPSTSQFAEPLLWVSVAALLINLAVNKPQLLNQLDNNIRYIFGGPTASRS